MCYVRVDYTDLTDKFSIHYRIQDQKEVMDSSISFSQIQHFMLLYSVAFGVPARYRCSVLSGKLQWSIYFGAMIAALLFIKQMEYVVVAQNSSNSDVWFIKSSRAHRFVGTSFHHRMFYHGACCFCNNESLDRQWLVIRINSNESCQSAFLIR